MKVAIMGAGDFVADRMIESFHLGDGPTFAAVARHPADLTRAARFAVDLRVADMLSVDSLARSFSGCSAVVNAGRFAPGEAKRGTTALCRAAAQAGIRRIVSLSSADVHGPCPPDGTDERSVLHTDHADDSHNALVQAERQFFTECRQLGIAGYALRAGFLYGPRSPAIVNLAAALDEGRAWLAHQGKGICNCLYVDNLISAVRLALKTKTTGAAFLVADSETVTWGEFYQSAAHELNAPLSSIRLLDDRHGNPGASETPASANAPSNEKSTPPVRKAGAPSPLSPELMARQMCTWKLPTARATRDLGHRASVSFADAMRRSCAWWRFAHGEFFEAA